MFSVNQKVIWTATRRPLKGTIAACDGKLYKDLPNGYGLILDDDPQQRVLQVFEDEIKALPC